MRAGLSCLLGLVLAACGRVGYEQVQLGEWPADGPADGPVDGPAADRPPDAPPDALPDAPPDLPPVDTRPDVTGDAPGPSAMALTSIFGRQTGTQFLDWCPDDTVLVGLEGAAQPGSGTLYASLVGLCGTPQLTSSPPYRVTSYRGLSPLPARGSGEVVFSQTCSGGGAIVGFEGRADAELRALSFVCADLVVASGPAGYELVPGSNRTVEPLMNVAGGTPFEASCPAGFVARGTRLWAGQGIHAFGLACSTFAVQP
jgi:hypothetical protein